MSNFVLYELRYNWSTKTAQFGFDLIDADETIWYYDWGSGSIDLVFKVMIKKGTETHHLVRLAEKLNELNELDYSSDKKGGFKLKFVEKWEKYSKVLLRLLIERSENGAQTHDQETSCDITGYYHNALIMKSGRDKGLRLNEEEFTRLLESFSGKGSGEWKYTTSMQEYGILVCVDGFNGSVAILDPNFSREGPDVNSLAEKIKWNYRLAMLYHPRLIKFADELAKWTNESLNSEKEYKRDIIDRSRNKMLGLQLFLNEMSPATVAVSDIINYHIYNGISKDLRIDETVKEIEKQLSYLQSYYSDSISLKLNSLQTETDIYETNNEVRSAVDQILTLAKELPYQRLKAKPGPSEKQRSDYEQFEYECHDKIHIPGKIPLNRSNFMGVNENEIKLGDSLFVLFLRLVVELKKGKGGWVDIHTLKSEGIIHKVRTYQIYSNLRTALQGSLLDKEGLKFIQGDGSKKYRISTHPDFITYDKEKLLNHPEFRIRDIATKLP